MNRKLISDAIGDIDDMFIEETMFRPTGDCGLPSERTIILEKKTIRFRRFAGLILAACLVFSLAMSAYAADLGGIRRIIQIWRHGDQTTAVLNIQDGQYTISDEAGDVIRGGGVAFEPDGSERPLTEDEILEHLDQPELWYETDGTVWLSYHGRKTEITDDMFDAEGICYLKLRDGDDVIYVTVRQSGGMATSPYAYVQPEEFGSEKVW